MATYDVGPEPNQGPSWTELAQWVEMFFGDAPTIVWGLLTWGIWSVVMGFLSATAYLAFIKIVRWAWA